MSRGNGAVTDAQGRPLPPGPDLRGLWQTLRWVVRPTAFLEECHRRYGDVFTLRIAQEGVWVLLADPEAIREVFRGDPEQLRAGEGNAILRPLLGDSVLLLDGQAHLRRRKLMLPPFHGERMKGYGDMMREATEAEIARFPVGRPFPVWPHTQAITLDVITRAVMGVEDPARRERLAGRIRPMLNFLTKKRRMFLAAVVGPERLRRHEWTGFPEVVRRVEELLYEEIRHRRGDPATAERSDILSMLIGARDEDGEPLTEQELRDELLTLLVAGHETTATALAWALERLTHHPQALTRLREEVDAGDDAYLDAVIHETLRLRPVLPLVVRKLREPLEIGGYHLPAGYTVAPSIYLTHRRPDVYPEPHAFRPERFLGEAPGTYTWLPFGGGVRRCLGASFAMFEMKVVLRTMVEQLELAPDRPEPERVSRRAITFSPSRGGRIVVHPRVRPAGSTVPEPTTAAA
jgi:cytochrome P450